MQSFIIIIVNSFLTFLPNMGQHWLFHIQCILEPEMENKPLLETYWSYSKKEKEKERSTHIECLQKMLLEMASIPSAPILLHNVAISGANRVHEEYHVLPTGTCCVYFGKDNSWMISTSWCWKWIEETDIASNNLIHTVFALRCIITDEASAQISES
jgi:hypothetical protein